MQADLTSTTVAIDLAAHALPPVLPGYRAAMRRHGLADRVRVVTGGDTERDGHRAAAELLAGNRLPTAVCAYDDHCVLDRLEGRTSRAIETVRAPRLVARGSTGRPAATGTRP